MKKKIFGLMLTALLTLGAGAVCAYGADASLYPTNGSFSFDAETDIGETFEVSFYLQNSSQFDSTTFYILYDPEVVIFKSGITVDEDEAITYPVSDTRVSYLISAASLDTAAAIVKKSTPIYQKQPDGVSTAAELGEIKLAAITGSYGGNGGLYQITSSGILFSAEFEVVGAGSTEIEVVGTSSMFASTDHSVGSLDVDTTPCSIYVSGSSEATTTTVSSSSSDSDSETTTAASTSSSSSDSTSSDSSSSSSGGGSSGSSGSTGSTGSTSSDSADDSSETAADDTAAETETGETAAETSVEYAFPDLEETPWAAEAVNYLASLKIVNGYNDGTFLPKNNVTRADFIIMLLNTLGVSGEAEGSFTDVREDKYYANYVCLAKDLGIAQGYSDGSFEPEDYITRQDMMVLTARAYEAVTGESLSSSNTEALADFNDTDEISSYAQESIIGMVEAGIVNGSNGNISPKAGTTRAETAVIMYNVLKYIESAE
ncbi:MAG: S-layer homology domain-containing protein [Clostridiales bacterium]|nr:S-layer homology domain-containing protein [Clostridiales bacterium]